jgi:hypothetical protein
MRTSGTEPLLTLKSLQYIKKNLVLNLLCSAIENYAKINLVLFFFKIINKTYICHPIVLYKMLLIRKGGGITPYDTLATLS